MPFQNWFNGLSAVLILITIQEKYTAAVYLFIMKIPYE